MGTEIRYKLRDYDGGLDAHPEPEPAGQLWLVDGWWELHFKGVEAWVNGELTDYVLEALPVDDRSCLVSICEPERDGEILCSFVLPDTSAERLISDLERSLGSLGESREGSEDRDPRQPSDFPVSITTLLGQELRLRFLSTGRRRWSAMRGTLESSDGQPVARLGLYGPGVLAEMVCRDGTWCLRKRRNYGWELVIESSDGGHVGWYAGRRWLAGGTISLADGTRVDLRRSRTLGWDLRASGTREPILQIARLKSGSFSLTVYSLPAEVYSNAAIVVLTTCAVLMLMALTADGSSGSGSGGG